MGLNIVFVEPEIPYNTGAVARSCGLTKSSLHLIRPLGFSVYDSHLKRAGLDYWNLVDIHYYDSFKELYEKFSSEHSFYFATTKTKKKYSDVTFKDGDFIVFGRETKGLSKEILELEPEHNIRIPMLKDFGRSLNLANSANIILFEALRQLDFNDLE
ncbi:MAG: tRNA (cytidine(34)-2'-O)-methyltransferase [Tissierellia bacterium]|nr:tRNA (cytidine(34)-2'-O)-methyltransferase [Tissierellia bacterium]